MAEAILKQYAFTQVQGFFFVKKEREREDRDREERERERKEKKGGKMIFFFYVLQKTKQLIKELIIILSEKRGLLKREFNLYTTISCGEPTSKFCFCYALATRFSSSFPFSLFYLVLLFSISFFCFLSHSLFSISFFVFYLVLLFSISLSLFCFLSCSLFSSLNTINFISVGPLRFRKESPALVLYPSWPGLFFFLFFYFDFCNLNVFFF